MEMDENTKQKLHISTPLIESTKLGKNYGFRVMLKCENCQPIGSYKIRGIGRLMQMKYNVGIVNVITASSGNAGLAVAYSAQQLGMEATVLVPKTSPKSITEEIPRLGSKLVIFGNNWNEANDEALRLANLEGGATYISSFDNPIIWNGHSTMVDEIKQQLDDVKPSCIVVSVGGGGFLAGIIEGTQNNNWNDVPIIAVETAGAACFNAAVASGKHVTLETVETIARSLSAKTVAKRVFEAVVNKEHPIISITVTDEEALDACFSFLDDHRFLVEPACGASLAILYNGMLNQLHNDGKINLKSGPTVIMVCGGAGVSLEQLHKWKKELSQKATSTVTTGPSQL